MLDEAASKTVHNERRTVSIEEYGVVHSKMNYKIFHGFQGTGLMQIENHKCE